MLDEWLRRYAALNRRRDTAATWVISDSKDVVVACASVADPRSLYDLLG